METEKKVTLREIAERMGVSLVTVHRAIHGKSGISEETRRRVMEEVDRCGYRVDEAASLLKRGVRTVAVILPRPYGENRFYFSPIWQDIRKAAKAMAQYKIDFRFVESEYSISRIAEQLEQSYDEMANEIDGLITMADREESSRWVERFANRNIPVILISSDYSSDRKREGIIECIHADYRTNGYLAAEFMSYGLSGRRGKVLAVGGMDERYSIDTYLQSFQEEIARSCPECEVSVIRGMEQEDVQREFERRIREEPFDGIFVSSARNTYMVCRALEKNGQGRDTLVVGSDIFRELVPYFENGILNASVCQYNWEMGSRAVSRIHEHLNKGDRAAADITLPSILVMKNNFRYFIDMD